MNQRSRYPSGIQKPAKSMDDFCKSVGDPPPEDLPKLVRDIWQAIDDFSKSVDGDLPDFRKLIAGQLNGLTPPPSGYETLTLKDAERLGSIQIILGSREYGMVEAGEKKTDSVQMDWNTIKEHIDGSLDYANKPPTNKPVKVLLRVLGDSFGLSQKKETTQ